jgi:hypothetical protein
MHESPSATEILGIVGRYLNEVAGPALSGQAAFHARVAANALAIVARELAQRPEAEAGEKARLVALLGQDGSIAELNSTLCAAIADGSISLNTPGLFDHLDAATIAQVSIDQPKYAGLALAKARQNAA